MPITSPIYGADEAPSITRVYTALSSMSVISADDYPALSSLDIESISKYEALESVDVKKTTDRLGGGSSIDIGDFTVSEVHRSVTIVNGDSFIILVDALAEELSGSNLGSFGQLEINAQLLVDNVAVAIKSFSYQVPTGRLGSILNVVLADPDVSVVPNGASIKFSLVVRIDGTDHFYTLMDNGKLQERDSTVQYKGGNNDGPKDEVTFGALDVIADKFGLAPRRPVVMFDPYRVKFDEVSTDSRNAVRDERGGLIYPVIEPVFNLTMKQILARAYTGGGGLLYVGSFGGSTSWSGLIGSALTDQVGCGFSRVITNVADYPVRRADFSIESGWHDGAQPVVAMYHPLYFVEGTQLFIIDVDKVLPYGAVPHSIMLSDHKSLSEKIAFTPDTNAVLLTYQYANNDPSEDGGKLVREVFKESIDEAGSGIYYSKTTTRRWDYEYFFADDPTNVLSTLPKSVDIETVQSIVYSDVDGVTTNYGTRTTHKETTDYTYEGELLVNSRKIVQGIVNVGASASMDLIDLEREDTHIVWTDDPYNPGVKLQDRVITDIHSLVVVGTEEETFAGPAGDQTGYRQFPILLAQASGIMTIDSILSPTMIPIKSIRETLHQLSGNQFDVLTLEIDYLNNTVKRSYSQPVTGSNGTSQYGSKSRTILFRDLESEAEIGPRIPLAINSYELPRLRAIELAQNTLRRIKNPLMQLPISLPGVDFTIARGSIIRGQKRNGSYTPNYIVTGYNINGENLGHDGHRISQTLEAIEMLTPS